MIPRVLLVNLSYSEKDHDKHSLTRSLAHLSIGFAAKEISSLVFAPALVGARDQ